MECPRCGAGRIGTIDISESGEKIEGEWSYDAQNCRRCGYNDRDNVRIEDNQSKKQRLLVTWAGTAFGAPSLHISERGRRFLEEAIELAQTCGVSEEEALQHVKYTYNRPAGTPQQEIGGVMVTLSVLAEVLFINVNKAFEIELTRIFSKPLMFWRAKHNAKIDQGISKIEKMPVTDKASIE